MEIRAASRSGPPPDVGLLIVHGIGEQKLGETAGKLVEGLSSVYGDRLAVTRDGSGVPVQLRLDERTVRLYEVYWADILSGDRVKSTFRWEVVQALGWFPWLNWQSGLLHPPLYSRRLALVWSVFLVPITLALYVLYMGARMLAPVFRNDTRPEVNVEGLRGWAKYRAIGDAYAEHGAHGRSVVEDVLDAFAGDVTNYMSSLGRTDLDRDGLGGAGQAILDRLYVKLAEALDDGCREIQVLCHSLGTVIAYHGLTGQFVGDTDPTTPRARSYDPIPKLTRLYSIGSPLEKIRFFWPTSIGESLLGPFTVVEGHACRAEERGASSHGLRWDNFHHRFDVVSGRLKRFEHWGGVRNYSLKGGGGMMRSHVIYERSPEFLAAITEGLFGEPASPRESWSSRLRDQVLSTLENLALPLGLVALLVMGLVPFLLVVLLPGYVVSLPFRAVGSYAWAHGIQNAVTVLYALVVAVAALRYPFQAQRKARALHSIWTKSESHPFMTTPDVYRRQEQVRSAADETAPEARGLAPPAP